MSKNWKKPNRGESTPLPGEWRWATIHRKRREILHFAEVGGVVCGLQGQHILYLGELTNVSEPIVDPLNDSPTAPRPACSSLPSD